MKAQMFELKEFNKLIWEKKRLERGLYFGHLVGAAGKGLKRDLRI